jgi:hypothetical protein
MVSGQPSLKARSALPRPSTVNPLPEWNFAASLLFRQHGARSHRLHADDQEADRVLL